MFQDFDFNERFSIDLKSNQYGSQAIFSNLSSFNLYEEIKLNAKKFKIIHIANKKEYFNLLEDMDNLEELAIDCRETGRLPNLPQQLKTMYLRGTVENLHHPTVEELVLDMMNLDYIPNFPNLKIIHIDECTMTSEVFFYFKNIADRNKKIHRSILIEEGVEPENIPPTKMFRVSIYTMNEPDF